MAWDESNARFLSWPVDEPALKVAAVNEEPPSAFRRAELCVDGHALDRSEKASA
jgi:hypothetical protein